VARRLAPRILLALMIWSALILLGALLGLL